MNIPNDRAQKLKDDLFDPKGYAGRHYAADPPVGTRIRLLEMPNDPAPLPAGSEGTVRGHGPGQVWVDWDSGSRLCVLPGVDKWEVIEGLDPPSSTCDPMEAP